MKILFLIDTLGSGGKERRLTELLKAVNARQDIDAELIIMSRAIHYKEVLDLGIKIHYVIRKTKKDISVFYRLYKLCRSCSPDIVHCWDSMTALYMAPSCRLLHIKLVNGMIIDSPLQQNIFNKHWLRAKLTFPLSDMIVANSYSGLKAYKAPVRKSVTIYNGFNFQRTNNLPPREAVWDRLGIYQGFVIGMIASYADNKDYDTFLRAAVLLLNTRHDLTFLAIGKNTDAINLDNIIDKQYLKYFRLLGKRSDIESLINAMDICVLSTFTEGISNSILEYMALRKPVIATRGGGTSEIVRDGVSGFLVNPSDPVELSGEIEKLLSDAQLREKMGSAGEKRVREEFTMEQMVNKYIEVYTNLLSD